MILKNTKLRNRLKEILKRNKEVEDILLFGSAARGKENPADFDILVMFKEKIDKNVEHSIRKELEKEYDNISIISKNKDTALEPSFDARESIMFEGKSILTGKNIAKTYGFDSLGMFKYGFKGWTKVKRIKFYHALNGRDKKGGILQSLNCIKASDGIILAPIDKIEPMRSFLDSWKIDYKYIPILIPERLNKKQILEPGND